MREEITRWDKWRTAIAVVFAAVASIATSAPSWGVSAPVTPTVVPDQKVYRYTLTASSQPYTRVSGLDGVPTRTSTTTTPPAWTGSQTLDLYAGSKLEAASIGDDCTGGGCGDCDPPEGSFLTVTGPEVLDAWEKSAEADVSLEKTFDTGSCTPGEGGDITVEISGGTVGTLPNLTFSVSSPDLPSADLSPMFVTPSASFPSIYYVHFGPAALNAINWKVTATIRGACATEAGACTPPPDEEIKIVVATGTRCRVTR